MADIKALYDATGKLRGYQARTRVDGKQIKRNFLRSKGETKNDADLWVAQLAIDQARGQYIDERAGKTTVADYARQWAAARPHRKTTADRMRSQIEVHIAGTPLGEMQIRRVRPSHVQAWATSRAQVLAPSTVRLCLSTLRSVFAAAVLDRVIASSPVVRVQVPRAEKARIVPLTVQQVVALSEAMPPRYGPLVVVQAALGLRLGELTALRVQDVDFLRRVVHVETQFPSGSRERTDPKTPMSKRDVPLPKVAGDAIARYLAEHAPADDGTIFTNEGGRPHRGDWYGTRVFRKAVEAAGLPEGTTSHDLRHHYASVLLAAGESVVAVAERLGHDDASLVLRTYGHLIPGSDDRTRRAVDDAWCDPNVPAEAVTRL